MLGRKIEDDINYENREKIAQKRVFLFLAAKVIVISGGNSDDHDADYDDDDDDKNMYLQSFKTSAGFSRKGEFIIVSLPTCRCNPSAIFHPIKSHRHSK